MKNSSGFLLLEGKTFDRKKNEIYNGFALIVAKKGGGHASNPLQLRIVSICYGKHLMSPEVISGICLIPY